MSSINNIETKEIGFAVGVNGTHHNTIYDEISKTIQLAVSGQDDNGNKVYFNEGYWISETINLGDKFLDYEKLFITNVDNSGSSVSAETRVSNDGVTFGEWSPIAADGNIQSETMQYIQIKVNFFAAVSVQSIVISNFKSSLDSNLFDSNYIDTSNGLKLKRNYNFNMEKDSSWIEEGSIHRKKITRDEWIRIDKLLLTK